MIWCCSKFLNHQSSLPGWWYNYLPLWKMMEFGSWDHDIPKFTLRQHWIHTFHNSEAHPCSAMAMFAEDCNHHPNLFIGNAWRRSWDLLESSWICSVHSQIHSVFSLICPDFPCSGAKQRVLLRGHFVETGSGLNSWACSESRVIVSDFSRMGSSSIDSNNNTKQ